MDKNADKEQVKKDIKDSTYIDRKDVKDECTKEKIRRDANGGWSN